MAIEVGSDDQLKESGTTDTGNSYELTYRNNNANIKVTCSEIAPADEEAEDTENTENTAGETAQASTTSVITAGAGQTADNQETTEAAAEEEAEAETEETAEETAEAADSAE
jgi:hypothetical protein